MSDIEQMVALLQSIEKKNEMLEARLEESMTDRVIRLEDVGWTPLIGHVQQDDGLTLTDLHTVSEKLRELAGTNPWHIQGNRLRHSYIFGRGMNFIGVKPGTQKILDDAHNKESLFSVDAYRKANNAAFTDGQFIVRKNETTKKFMTIPINQITAVVTDPDDEEDIRYVRRSWTANGTAKNAWIPTARHKKAMAIVRTIEHGGAKEPVEKDAVVYIRRVNRQVGWTWGVPDSLGAMIWTLAYSGYLQDSAQLVKALSKFAWTITRNTTSGASSAATQVVSPGVGGTAVSAGGQALASVGVPSAQVNMNNGQPLIAAVAASFGVPVIALMESPGATGGSYGAATTLDSPTLKIYAALQDEWADFYAEILRDLGSPNAEVSFPSIDADAPYRQITSIVTAVELGVIWREEARDAVLNILDVVKQRDDLPPLPDYPDKSGSLVSGQGRSGSGIVPDSTDMGDTNHDNDESR